MSYVSLLAIFSHAAYLILSAVSCASLETNAEICMTQFVECCAKWELRPKNTSTCSNLLPSKILVFLRLCVLDTVWCAQGTHASLAAASQVPCAHLRAKTELSGVEEKMGHWDELEVDRLKNRSFQKLWNAATQLLLVFDPWVAKRLDSCLWGNFVKVATKAESKAPPWDCVGLHGGVISLDTAKRAKPWGRIRKQRCCDHEDQHRPRAGGGAWEPRRRKTIYSNLPWLTHVMQLMQLVGYSTLYWWYKFSCTMVCYVQWRKIEVFGNKLVQNFYQYQTYATTGRSLEAFRDGGFIENPQLTQLSLEHSLNLTNSLEWRIATWVVSLIYTNWYCLLHNFWLLWDCCFTCPILIFLRISDQQCPVSNPSWNPLQVPCWRLWMQGIASSRHRLCCDCATPNNGKWRFRTPNRKMVVIVTGLKSSSWNASLEGPPGALCLLEAKIDSCADLKWEQYKNERDTENCPRLWQIKANALLVYLVRTYKHTWINPHIQFVFPSFSSHFDGLASGPTAWARASLPWESSRLSIRALDRWSVAVAWFALWVLRCVISNMFAFARKTWMFIDRECTKEICNELWHSVRVLWKSRVADVTAS